MLVTFLHSAVLGTSPQSVMSLKRDVGWGGGGGAAVLVTFLHTAVLGTPPQPVMSLKGDVGLGVGRGCSVGYFSPFCSAGYFSPVCDAIDCPAP